MCEALTERRQRVTMCTSSCSWSSTASWLVSIKEPLWTLYLRADFFSARPYRLFLQQGHPPPIVYVPYQQTTSLDLQTRRKRWQRGEENHRRYWYHHRWQPIIGGSQAQCCGSPLHCHCPCSHPCCRWWDFDHRSIGPQIPNRKQHSSP